ncbi:MAG: hypothetical protein RL518_1159 [Pseudomonadota bacterium]|jgi:hypothetical protein
MDFLPSRGSSLKALIQQRGDRTLGDCEATGDTARVAQARGRAPLFPRGPHKGSPILATRRKIHAPTGYPWIVYTVTPGAIQLEARIVAHRRASLAES